MPKGSITMSAVSFAWDDRTPVFVDLTCALGAGRTGLVAPNGAGKTTMLRLVVGELVPTAGTVVVDGELGYLPQKLALDGQQTIAQVLGIAEVVAAIAAIERGEPSEENFALVGDNWDVEQRALAILDQLGLGGVGIGRPLRTISGGQATSLGLAAQLLRRPDVLLLDEPTNNLDAVARRRLHAVVDAWPGCLVAASHDRELLDRMDQIAELAESNLALFGGNFSAYTEALAQEHAAAERAVQSSKQDLRRQRREAQEARERAARRAGNARRGLGSAGIPKIHANYLAKKSQESAGRVGDVHAQRIDAARTRLDQATARLPDDDVIVIAMPETSVPTGRIVLECERVTLRYDDAAPVFAEAGISLAVRGPERIGLLGANGAGKTTLLRLIEGTLQPTSGVIRRPDRRIAYLSQRLDLLDADKSVLTNLQSFAPGVEETQLRHRLAQFLFRGDSIHRPVRVLSGGELLRATLACLLSARPAPQLLLLDEPTNNLDLASVRQLESALNHYQGAFIVCSHDSVFLRAISVGRWLTLADGTLRDVDGPPDV